MITKNIKYKDEFVIDIQEIVELFNADNDNLSLEERIKKIPPSPQIESSFSTQEIIDEQYESNILTIKKFHNSLIQLRERKIDNISIYDDKDVYMYSLCISPNNRVEYVEYIA